MDVVIHADVLDGRHLTWRADRIDGQADELRVRLGEPLQLPSEGIGVTDVGSRELQNVVTVDYSDERRLLRWRISVREIHRFTRDSRGSGRGMRTERSEELLNK